MATSILDLIHESSLFILHLETYLNIHFCGLLVKILRSIVCCITFFGLSSWVRVLGFNLLRFIVLCLRGLLACLLIYGWCYDFFISIVRIFRIFRFNVRGNEHNHGRDGVIRLFLKGIRFFSLFILFECSIFID